MRFVTEVLRAVVRIFAVGFGLLGLGGLAALGAVLVAGNGLAGQLLGRVWFQHDPFVGALNSPSIQLVQVFFERKLSLPQLWNPGVTTLLNWPSWMALGAVALVGLVLCFGLLRMTRRHA